MPRVRSQKGVIKPQVGQDEVTTLRVFNPGPDPVSAGDIVVEVENTVGNSIYQHVQPALSTDLATVYYISMGSIPVGEYGLVNRWQILTDQALDPLAGAARGQPLFLSGATEGAYTRTAPANPKIVGVILYAHASEGRALLWAPGSVSYMDALSVVVNAANLPSGATQVAAGAAAGELWVTASHATLPDGVVLRGV